MKILVICLLLSFTSLINAQEKQNDASIEETINWINEYGFPKSFARKWVDDPKLVNLKYNKKDNSLSYDLFWDNSDKHPHTTFIIKNNEHPLSMKIRFNQEDEMYYIYIGGQTYLKDGVIFSKVGRNRIDSKNKEHIKSLAKAFEHLFYLTKIKVEIINKLSDKNKF